MIHLALIRGINVGGKTLKMDALRASWEAHGLKHVQTYIQSGNVLFETKAISSEALAKTLAAYIQADFNLEVGMVVRSLPELAKVTVSNPFLKKKGVDPTKLHVTFLAAAPKQDGLANLAGIAAGDDEHQVVGREIYLHCPLTYGDTKLSNKAIEKAVGLTATTRNWKTVNILLALGKVSLSRRPA